MWLKKIYSWLILVVQFDLQSDRVGFQVDKPAGGAMFRKWDGCPVQVNDQFSRAIKLLKLFFPQAVTNSVSMQRVKGPFIFQIKAIHHLGNKSGRLDRAVVLLTAGKLCRRA